MWLFVARVGAGTAGATISTAQAYIADTTSVANRARSMALFVSGLAFATPSVRDSETPRANAIPHGSRFTVQDAGTRMSSRLSPGP